MADLALTPPVDLREPPPPLSSGSTAFNGSDVSTHTTHTLHRPHGPAPFRAPLREDPHIIHWDKREQVNSKYQVTWEQNFRNGNKFESSYERVVVLLISWHVNCDDLKTKEEVEKLERVFLDHYHYEVKKIFLRSDVKQLPQVQAHYYISQFVYDEDGPQNLLIVYYAGHGTPGSVPGHLELSGKRDHTIDEVDKYVLWHLAEAPLQKTEADVFAIFDCCYAGDSRNGHFSERSFEFLAATSAGHVTRTPGPHSFTSGLIWALVQLAEERGKFTTSELSNKVRDSPGFPKDQVPVLYERGRASSKRIVLAPLSEIGTATEEPLEQSCASLSSKSVLLDLKFVFANHPEEADIANLAKAMSEISQSQSIVRQVTWGGIHVEFDLRPPVDLNSPIMQQIIDKWRDMSRRRSFSSLSSTPNLPTDISKPFHSTMPPSIRVSDESLQGGLNSQGVDHCPTLKECVLDIIYHCKVFAIRFYNHFWGIGITASLYPFSRSTFYVLCIGYFISIWLGFKM